jgi:hypothetical protein
MAILHRAQLRVEVQGCVSGKMTFDTVFRLITRSKSFGQRAGRRVHEGYVRVTAPILLRRAVHRWLFWYFNLHPMNLARCISFSLRAALELRSCFS